MNILFKIISLSLTLCVWDKFTLQATDLPANYCPLLASYDDPAYQRTTAVSVRNPLSNIPEHLHHARLSLEGVVLFNGPTSYKIKASTLSKWSHVGLWIRDTRYHRDDRKGWYVLGSGINSTSISASPNAKIRLVPWNDSISTGDDITQRHFHYQNKATPSSCALKRAINNIARQSEVANDVGGIDTKENPHSIGCSELNVLVLQDLGLLSKTKAANAFVPAHFSLERKPSALPLIDAHLGREHVVQQSSKSIFRTVFESVTGALRFCASKLRLIWSNLVSL